MVWPAGATSAYGFGLLTPGDTILSLAERLAKMANDAGQAAKELGISRATIASALDGMTLDPGVIARDRRQSFFAQSFQAFSSKLISQNRIQNGTARLRQHRDLLAKVEQVCRALPVPVIGNSSTTIQ